MYRHHQEHCITIIQAKLTYYVTTKVQIIQGLPTHMEFSTWGNTLQVYLIATYS